MTIILLLTVIAIQVITFHKLNKKIMGAEAKFEKHCRLLSEVISNYFRVAFNTQERVT
jgi:hypothetical protein